MKIEALKQSHLKRNMTIVLIVMVIISVVILNFTRAKYRVTESIPLVNGTINYNLADLNAVAIYVNSDSGYTKSDTIPESGYVLNEEESYCTVNGERDTNISLNYNVETKSLSISPLTTRGTKCYLYFDKKGITTEEIIATKRLSTRTDFTNIVTEDTTGTIYYVDTSKGRTYYFAGAPTDNWVYFGGFYWRIIRINEDGTIRIIYQGTEANTTGEGTQIGVSTFNNSSGDNMFIGYMYQSGVVHGLQNDSVIKIVLDEWYQNNLQNYTNYIDGNAGFCGDRTPSTSDSTTNYQGGTGTTKTYYPSYIRLYKNSQPSLECPDEDLYTTTGSINGNKALQYPIGLINADEVTYAGGVYGGTTSKYDNTSYYLYTGQDYWTMSPFYNIDINYLRICRITSYGRFGSNDVTNSYGVRPVINLKANVTINGTGTATNPYTIS